MKKYIFMLAAISMLVVNGYCEDSIGGIQRNNEAVTENSFFKNGRQAFAFGIDFKAVAANSYFNIADLFKETLEVDLPAMSQALPNAGLSVSGAGAANVYLDIYIKSKAEFGFFCKS